ncbi:hypothetical protein [Breoghania sp.]|uniref:hypothetical protein n=1 Tax=Breoghania sp. TaxID=2065378 RepID=UPI00261F06DF|nr:hypothetical protein [Breoghania sp.]MDJ0932064.1 hypothetical protein [Breoghania sp.]
MAGDEIIRLGLPIAHKATTLAIALVLTTVTVDNAAYRSCCCPRCCSAPRSSSSRILSVWTMRVFRHAPSIGIGYTFLIFTLGAMLGPFFGFRRHSHRSLRLRPDVPAVRSPHLHPGPRSGKMALPACLSR